MSNPSRRRGRRCNAHLRLLVALSLAGVASCDAPAPEGQPPEPEVVRSVSGDTVFVWNTRSNVELERPVEVLAIGEADAPDLNYLFGRIRSIAVGVDGSIFVLESQVPEVRQFDPEGRWIRTFGGRGEGPGDLGSPGAIATSGDGRLLARDNGNARLQGFSLSERTTWEWPVVDPTYGTMRPLWVDTLGRAHVVTRDPDRSFGEPGVEIVRVVDIDGEVVRQSPPPGFDLETPTATAVFEDERGRGSSSSPVPFTARAVWAVDPSGAWVSAITDEYRVAVHGPDRDGVLQFGRAASPVSVGEDERRAAMDRVERAMRRTQPDWSWGGLEVPRSKPPIRTLFSGLDGSTWVQTSQPAVERPNPRHDRSDLGSPTTIWVEPLAFDVFDRNGDFVRSVLAPPDLQIAPAPVFRRDTIWGISRDDLGVERVKIWAVGGR